MGVEIKSTEAFDADGNHTGEACEVRFFPASGLTTLDYTERGEGCIRRYAACGDVAEADQGTVEESTMEVE
jgi:hypothetical protein